ncbi:MAG: HAD family hydrolase [Bacteroidota bacterium]|nr:HAD family hydrolase [Bacteroidota bacterium]MDP4229477.1 HAD family hydrolase [Bacteroidota bacterium]
MSSRIKVVFFDLDDTLYDHSFHIHSGISALREQHSFLQAHSIESLNKLSHDLLEEVHARLLLGEISLNESRRIRWYKFLKNFGQELNFDPIEFSDSYLRAYYGSERALPGAIDLLRELRKEYRIGIISNNLLEEQLAKMRRIGIIEYIDFYAISDDVGFAKPDRRIFEIALERGGVSQDEAVFIGDSWHIDITGALTAGIRPIWLNRSGMLPPEPGIAEIPSLEPVERVLNHIRSETPTPTTTNAEPPSA